MDVLTRLGPRLVDPVTRVRSSLTSLLGDGLVVRANLLEKSVSGAGLRNWDAVLVREGLEL